MKNTVIDITKAYSARLYYVHKTTKQEDTVPREPIEDWIPHVEFSFPNEKITFNEGVRELWKRWCQHIFPKQRRMKERNI